MIVILTCKEFLNQKEKENYPVERCKIGIIKIFYINNYQGNAN